MKTIAPRIFTFDVVVSETADGRITKSSKGGPWLRLARKMSKAGTARLELQSCSFAGYSRSYDYGRHRLVYTVTEIV